MNLEWCKFIFTLCHVNVNNCQLWLQAVRIKKHTLINPSKNIVQLYTIKISVPFSEGDATVFSGKLSKCISLYHASFPCVLSVFCYLIVISVTDKTFKSNSLLTIVISLSDINKESF